MYLSGGEDVQGLYRDGPARHRRDLPRLELGDPGHQQGCRHVPLGLDSPAQAGPLFFRIIW
jgi:hypothetical protein